VKASKHLEDGRINHIVPAGFSDDKFLFYTVTNNTIHTLSYQPYYLKKSRHY